jgi:16S rRNA (guanine1207-N2)-methyltransferase
VDKSIKRAGEQKILDEQFISRPGVFGWDKADQGSQLLLQHIPRNLSGRGADFGCGYGFLSSAIMQQKSIR